MTDCQRRDGMTKTTFTKRSRARAAARKRGWREYRCPDCGMYHLTKTPFSKEKRMLDDIEEPIALPPQVETERRRSTYKLHYEGGAEVTILAFTAKDAVQLAGRGRPLQITNLTAIDEQWPS